MATTPNSVITPQSINAGTRCILSTAMTNTKAYDGTETAGTALNTFFTAGANGAIIDGIRIKFTSTDGATVSGTTSATVVRIWANNGSANTTATNNVLLFERALAAQALVALGTAEPAEYVITNHLPKLPAGYKLYAGLTVAAGGTNAAVSVSVISAGDL